MHEEINRHRRRFLSLAAVTVAGTRLGARGAERRQSASTKMFGELKQIDAGDLRIGYAEVGPSAGPAVVLLHGWPYDIHSFVDVAPLLATRAIACWFPICGATARPASFRPGRLAMVSSRLWPLTASPSWTR